MNYVQKLKKLFLYAGIEKEEYDGLRTCIYEENRILLKVFSQLAAVMFFLLYFASIVTGGFAAANTSTYLFCAAEMTVILLSAHLILPKHPSIVMMFVYIFEILLYAFGIHISMLHADMPAVSAVAFLLVTPLLFYDKPLRVSALIAIAVTVFCLIVIRFKQPAIAINDFWNSITFGIVAIVTAVFVMSIKIRALLQSKQIEYLSQTDLLTGLKNRNHYETQLQTYPSLCQSNLICIYADVNGLHEMNNVHGHAAGDRMLKEAAAELRSHFGEDHTYRIGGDEFVAFRPDGAMEQTLSELEATRNALSRSGYIVSFGIAEDDKTDGLIQMSELVRNAENRMFADKQNYYRQSGNDRRRR
ncbi:MAG: GGDEF domain-containing protein [Solobacterium sp.]|nr:GGDEF domain-containing protein [Solobacterium sp.]